jgi:hypoxanthine phosphoribosyltransferase|tara:strand:+ start:2633 stop:3211 length:579 start_codon:yes stop_codon:yes gene_type:complete
MVAPTPYLGAGSIADRVADLALELDEVLEPGAVLVGVLKGCLPFMADLIRQISTPIVVDFLALSAFAPDSGRVRLTNDLSVDVEGRQVVLVEGVVDTGFRLDYLRRHVIDHGPSEVRICTLFDRAGRRVLPIPIDHVGFATDAAFLVGYGLDHRGEFRNLPGVVEVELADLGRAEDGFYDEVRNAGRSGARH